jgi:hypothetical protein
MIRWGVCVCEIGVVRATLLYIWVDLGGLEAYCNLWEGFDKATTVYIVQENVETSYCCYGFVDSVC